MAALLLVVTLLTPSVGGVAWAVTWQDPPEPISVDEAKSAGLQAQITAYDQSVTAQQSVEQSLLTEKASLHAQIAKSNAALDADDAAGAATDQQFAELNREIQAYNAAGPPGDPAYAAELDAKGQELAAQQDQNNAKVRADNAEQGRLQAAQAAFMKKGAEYDKTDKNLADQRATLMAEVLAVQAAADLAVIATLNTVDSLNGMDSPRPDQHSASNDGRDSTAPPALSSCNHSFAAGTRVLMADGTTEPIQDVRVGDLVENAQPGGVNEVHRVDQVHATSTDTDFTRLAIGTPTGRKAITGTQNHPYYDRSIEAFANAANLKLGDRLQSTDAHANVTVLGVDNYTAHMATYDLTVNGLHTYYVVAGGTPILVHNSACGGGLAVLRDWTSQRFQFGSQTFLLDRSGMTHILERHAPAYWDGSVKAQQSFFDPSMSVSDIQNAIGRVMQQNRDSLMSRGSRGMYQIRGTVNGVNYVLGLNNGRVGQFYPVNG